jgi:hypothetical protein
MTIVFPIKDHGGPRNRKFCHDRRDVIGRYFTHDKVEMRKIVVAASQYFRNRLPICVMVWPLDSPRQALLVPTETDIYTAPQAPIVVA